MLSGQPSLKPPYRWPAPLAGCQPRVSWSMLVKRALIWVWQGNQQPNSTVKLNSVVEHRSASFMLRLQKEKVPQHQFVTESCSTRPETHTERERDGGRRVKREKVRVYNTACWCIRVAKCVCAMSAVTSPAAFNNRRKDLLQWCERAEWGKEKNRWRMSDLRMRGVSYKAHVAGRIVSLWLSFFFFC